MRTHLKLDFETGKMEVTETRGGKPPVAGSATGSGEITAMHIFALQLDANLKHGTPEHPKAVQMLELAKQMWHEKFIKKCPHCGSRLNNRTETHRE